MGSLSEQVELSSDRGLEELMELEGAFGFFLAFGAFVYQNNLSTCFFVSKLSEGLISLAKENIHKLLPNSSLKKVSTSV